MTTASANKEPSALRVTPVPAFRDNYLWLIDNGQQALVVDPGDAVPVIDALKTLELQLVGILVTHHHPDHIGGINALLKQVNVPVIGPDSENIPQVTSPVSHNSSVDLLGKLATVIAVPGHTLDHIAYFIDADSTHPPLLFCGDTLFAGGCGRVFEGTHAQMRNSLSHLANLPPETLVYCAHEYTEANLMFALAVEPDNKALKQRMAHVKKLRSADTPTVPSTIQQEQASNPFLRYDQAPVIEAACKRLRNAGIEVKKQLDADTVFAAIREWKDNF